MRLSGLLKILPIILLVLDVCMMFYYVYFVIPKDLVAIISNQHHQDMMIKIRSILNPVLYFSLFQLLLVVVFLYYERRYMKSHVIYVDKDQVEQQQHIENTDEQTTEQGYQERYKKILQKLEDEEFNYDVFLSEICNLVQASVGVIFVREADYLESKATYAYPNDLESILRYQLGEGITGQVALTGEWTQIKDIPKDCIHVTSGLGNAKPRYLSVFPIKSAVQQVVGVVELACFEKLSSQEIDIVHELLNHIGTHFDTLNT